MVYEYGNIIKMAHKWLKCGGYFMNATKTNWLYNNSKVKVRCFGPNLRSTFIQGLLCIIHHARHFTSISSFYLTTVVR